nr:cell surface protein [Bifidobacterium simiiventris]
MVPSAYAQNDSVLNSIDGSGVTVISDGKVVTDNTVVSAAESLAQPRAAETADAETADANDTANTNGTNETEAANNATDTSNTNDTAGSSTQTNVNDAADNANQTSTNDSFNNDSNTVFTNDNVFGSGNGLTSGETKTVRTNDAADSADVSQTGDNANTSDNADTESADQTNAGQSKDSGASADASDQSADTADAVPAAQADADATLDGRDFAGQVTKEIAGKTYILIGNEQQLRAIGSGKKVIKPIWKIETEEYQKNGCTETILGITYKRDCWVDIPDVKTQVYSGDADLNSDATLRDKKADSDDNGGAFPKVGDRKYHYVTLDDKGAEVAASNAVTGQTYTSTANYIIFRNIDLSKNAENANNTNWIPLMFSGTVVGAIAANGDTQGNLFEQIADDGLGVKDENVAKPVISNVVVHQTGELDTQNQQGIGFFASISPATTFAAGKLLGSGRVTVANLKLSDVTVSNESSKAKDNATLLGTITEGLGWILDNLLKLLHIELNLQKLLTLHAENPSNFATGAFAGRIYGDSHVVACEVENVSVFNVKNMTGGFVGYAEGSTQYDVVLSGTLGDLTQLLTRILNLIPYLGAGDLVNWLLSGVLGLDSLIPTGYDNPVISGSKVTNFKTGVTLGNADSDFAGGFVGMQSGTIIENSAVSSENAFTVRANMYAGGFAGVTRDGAIGGLLKSLDVDLLSALKPQSLIQESTLTATGGVHVQAISYVGGFSGAMANSYAVNDGVSGTVSVKAAKNKDTDKDESYAGGFTGKASVGWALDLGSADDSSKTVVKSVVNLVANLLKGNALNTNNSGDLLSLAGVSPSAILGTQMDGTIDVNAQGDYAGGLIGAGDGTVIGDSSKEHLEKFALWKYNNPRAFPAPRSTSIKGAHSVTAGGSYAGGVAGSLKPAAVAALLNGVLNINDVIGDITEELKKAFKDLPSTLGDDNQFATFELSNVTVEGDATNGLTVSANGSYAGGVIGFATGGNVQNVPLTNLAGVQAQGEAGGYIGFTGPSDTVGTQGINLLGLIQVSGLLSVAKYSSVEVRNASVAGVGAGFTVTATGKNTAGETNDYNAGGFYGQANSTKTIDAHVTNLKSVTADTEHADATAGGFVGYSTTGGLADAINDSEDTSLLPGLKDAKLLSINGLLGAVPYLIPNYKDTTVSYVNGGYVEGDIAGGFAGNFESGKINVFTADEIKEDATLEELQTKVKASPWAVINIDHVTGGAYAGGFGGKVVSGALATAGKGGISLLGKLGTVDITSLLRLVSGYVPFILYAGVKSDLDTFKAASADPDSVNENGDYGFTVLAKRLAGDGTTDLNAGSAGGFIGYGSGVQVSTSSVTQLRHTTVKAPKNLETTDAATISNTYLGSGSSYAVDSARYAGGYIGKMDIGSTAAVGEGLDLLGGTVGEINVQEILSVLDVVVSTIEHSDVTGGTGGYSVRSSAADHIGADNKSDPLGMAGGFVGDIEGGHIQNSNAHEFVYIFGQVAAGGYVGTMQPGAAANVLGKGNVFKFLLDASNAASAIQTFVPTIRNSSTDAVICGGAVRAQAASDTTTRRGMAGGYVGHNRGGHVWGNNSKAWSSIAGAAVTQHEAYAARIRSVYGHELAGGFTGFMEAADTADAGTISVLGGLVKAAGIVSALQLVYPTEEHTRVTGPLRNVSLDQWQTWVDNIGKYGAYGKEFTDVTKAGKAKAFADQTALDEFLNGYVFGFNVIAGRGQFAGDTETRQKCIAAAKNDKDALAKCYELGANLRDSGVAGGHVGLMRTGTITDGQSQDVKNVTAMRAAGGYVGSMEAGSVAKFGSVELLGLVDLDLGSLLGMPQIFVPVIKSSSVVGYRKGMTVKVTGTEILYGNGNAGGYVGMTVGGQIWGDLDSNGNKLEGDAKAARADVSNLRKVSGTNNVGGYVGLAVSGSTADVDTNASEGFLQIVLNSLINNANPAHLVNLLQATVVTIRGAHVSADDTAWGYTVEGKYTLATGTGDSAVATTKYAVTAGGFAGSLQAAILGDRNSAKGSGTATDTSNDPSENTVSDLRAVEGGQYAGGFFGLADVSSVASVGGGTSGTTEDTNLVLKLLNVGNVGVLEAFRTFIYDGRVKGVADGIQVKAHDSNKSGMLDTTRFTGSAGGFGGGLINGSVKKSGVTNLNSVTGLNYVGGFIGHLGKSGTVDASKAQVANGLLAGLTAGVLDIWGSHVEDSTVTGINAGYTVTATHDGAEYGRNKLLTAEDREGVEIAGGFVGYADLSRISGDKVTNLKKVSSGEIAGGFVGQTTKAYLVDAGVNSALVDLLLKYIVNPLLDILYVDKIQNIGNKLDDWKEQKFGRLTEFIDLELFTDGNALYVNLLGLKVGVALDKHGTEDDDTDDTADIFIGDSHVTVGCSKKGVNSSDVDNVKVQLIKANRTKINTSLVQGISDGYDVFGGGATQESDGTKDLKTGYAGGFVAVNDEGLLENNDMTYADTIRGTSGLVGPFSGKTNLESVYDFNTVYGIEGNGNTYHIYRDVPWNWSYALTKDRKQFTFGSHMDDGTGSTGSEGTSGVLKLHLNRYDVAHLARSLVPGTANQYTNPDIQQFSDYKDAVMANNVGGVNDESENGTNKAEPLAVYVSAAQADLMLGTAVTDNNGGLTPEPDDGQDPCGLDGCQTVDLTLKKVWKDAGAKVVRPQSITLRITATYTDANGKTVTPKTIDCSTDECATITKQGNPWNVVMDKSNASSGNADVWRKKISGLPVAFIDTAADRTQTVRYYTYTVKEIAMTYPGKDPVRDYDKTPTEAGYHVNVSYDSKEYVATVTNTVTEMPNTGGSGTQWIAMLAVIILGLGTAWYLHDTGKTGARRKRGKHHA